MMRGAPSPDRDRLHGLLIAALLAVAVGTPTALHAETDPQAVSRQLEDVRDALSQQRRTQQDAQQEFDALTRAEQALRTEMIEAAHRAQEAESALDALETELAALRRREAEARAALAGKSGQYARILMALARLAQTPPELVLALPGRPEDALRSALLLKAALPGVERHALDLRDRLSQLAGITGDIERRAAEIGRRQTALATERRNLAALLGRKSSLRQAAERRSLAAEKEVRRLTAKATDLNELLGSLRRLPKPETAPAPPPAPVVVQGPSRGALRLPARGRVVTLFGQERENPGLKSGIRAKGIELATRRGAQVVAPFDGKIVFAGPFRGYGQVLIIEHGEGYHSLIAGLTRLDGVVGQWVLAGEPIGAMGTEDPLLYYELRRNGGPLNPLPWLAARKDKVNG